MTAEKLEWLELSRPSPKTEKKPQGESAAPCPTCGWPVDRHLKVCPHCDHALADGLPVDLLGELNVKLLPPTLEVMPAPHHWFDTPAPDSPALYHLRLQAEQLQTTTGFNRLICLDDINVDHYQYQLEAALRALRDMDGQALLADEVGLGKTIEAGIVMKELIERGLANSVLILTPASLAWQWHEEMATKFFEEFTILEHRKQLPENIESADRCRWIISLDRAKSATWSTQLLAREYDLLIVDEAHKLKNHRTEAYKFVSQLRKRYVLMLTATPVHNDLMELYNLIAILRPGHLGTRRVFRGNFVSKSNTGSKRRALAWSVKGTGLATRMKSAANIRSSYSGWGDCRIKKIKGIDFTLDDLTNLPSVSQQDTLNISADIANFWTTRNELITLLQQGYRVENVWLATFKGRWQFKQFKGKLCGFRFELVQPGPTKTADTYQPIGKQRAVPRNPAALRHLLQEVMIRNRRSRVGVRFPPRQAAIYALDFSPPERELYDTVTAYIRRQLRQALEDNDKLAATQKMILMTLQKELCSSPQAVARTLKKLVNRQASPELAEALVLAWGIQQGRKVEATLSLLAQYPHKTLIFTDYLPSLETLHAALTKAGYETVIFHGGMSALERVEAVRQFRQSAQVMISTRSGGEGHNLQFCHQMINYDLPWNPMRIEQRVGRLHRLGQTETVFIFNLAVNQTIEAYILDLLAHKIRMFELVIGELDLILGELENKRGFEGYIEDAWAGSYTEEDLQQLLQELEKILHKAQRTYKEIYEASEELSDLLEAMDEVYGS
jgi:superfamily II DNA or RNA helicase